jgi:hypothetical protein
MTTRSEIAYVQQSGEGELRWMGETSAYFLADEERTYGAFALVDERANRGIEAEHLAYVVDAAGLGCRRQQRVDNGEPVELERELGDQASAPREHRRLHPQPPTPRAWRRKRGRRSAPSRDRGFTVLVMRASLEPDPDTAGYRHRQEPVCSAAHAPVTDEWVAVARDIALGGSCQRPFRR